MGTIKTVWQMSGEKEYKQTISDINRGVSVLDSEMKKINAVYKDNASSVEALNAKHDVLERTLLSQEEKVEVLRSALEKSAESYGESDRRTMLWQKSLNLAEAQVAETESAIRKNEEALQSVSDATDEATGKTISFAKAEEESGQANRSLGDGLDDLAGKFGVSLPNGIKGSLNKLGEMSSAAFATVAALAGVGAAIVGVEKKLVNLTVETAAAADEILTLSSTTGLSTDKIQELKYSSEFLDVGFDTVSKTLTRLKNNMQDARDGNDKLSTSFDALGVSVTNQDGSLRNSEDVFYEVIDALSQIKNATERDVVAMDLLGRSAEELNPLIEQGSAVLEELAKEAHEAGYVMDNESLAALGRVDDSYQRLQKRQEALKGQIAAEFAPVAEEAMDKVSDAIEKVGGSLIESGIVDSFGSILKSSIGIIDPLAQITGTLSGPLKIALESVSGTLQFINMTLSTISAGINAVTTAFSDSSFWGKANSDYKNAPVQSKTSLGSYYAKQYAGKSTAGRNAGGTQNWRGGMTWVGENGPELVALPSGSRIFNAQDSRSAGTTVINITIDAKNVREFNDIVALAENAKVERRMGGR